MKALIDLAMVGAAWLAAYLLRFGIFPAPKGLPDFFAYARLTPFVIVINLS